MKKFILIPLIFCIYLTTYGQSIKWQRVYTGTFSPGQDMHGNEIMISNNGSFFILGSYSQTRGRLLIKINPFGDTLFSKFYPNGTSFTGLSTNNGGFVTIGFGTTDTSYIGFSYASAFDVNGNLIRFNTFDTSSLHKQLIRTTDNYLITCGDRDNNGQITKIDTNLNLIWQKVFPAGWSKEYFSITEANNGSFIAVGHGFDSEYGTGYGLLTKINSSGDTIWEKKYTLFGYGFRISSINKLKNDKYLVFITTWDSIVNDSKPGFLKIDENGNIVYKKIFYELPYYRYRSFDSKIINDNRYIFSFDSYRFINDDSSLANIIITDSLGNIIKRKEYSGTSYTRFCRITLINENDYLFIGESDHLSNWDICIYAVRTDSTLEVPPLPIGIRNITSNIIDNFSLFQNYPNPFNPSTVIIFRIKETGLVKLKIFNILGKEIETLVNDKLHTGTYEIKFDGSNLPSGIYFYKLITDKNSITKKMLLLK